MSNQILLVDDDVDLLAAFAESLTLSGHIVITSCSAKEEIELYRKHCPCIVFSDIKMPGMDGYELFSKIHEIDPLAKMILVTGHEDRKKSILAKKCWSLGCSNQTYRNFNVS